MEPCYNRDIESRKEIKMPAPKFQVEYNVIVPRGCGCCSEMECREDEFDNLQDAFDEVEDSIEWRIYQDHKLILKGG